MDSTVLAEIKIALRQKTSNTIFDNEITNLVNACLIDLGMAGVTEDSLANDAVLRAVKTYCKMNFGDANGVEEYDRLKASYDEQKAQMSMHTGYTDWGNE